MSTIARRYALAAVEAAEDSGGSKDVERLAEGMNFFAKAYRESNDLRELLLNPALRSSHDDSLGALFKKLDLSATTAGVIRLLVRNDRVESISEIADHVEAIADEQAGRLRAKVTSAVALSEDQEKRVGKALEKRFGRPVVVTTQVNSELIGGLVCQVGDFTLDTSIRRQLNVLQEKLQATAG